MAKSYTVRLDNDLSDLAYKHQGDTKHKDMQSLVGVHIKNEMDEIIDQQTIVYPFMLIFPNKRRIYYLQTKVITP